MSRTLKGVAEQLLFASTVFIGFLLLFEDKVVLPVWLQSVGRMHPLFLHFPIVILLLAMGLEFFRFHPSNASDETYRKAVNSLLLVGALSAAVTIIMGLFLSREEGYTGAVLQRHKWSGLALFATASILYWGRNARWYSSALARGGALLTALLLITSGHYGAVLTHGDNFLLEPLTRLEKPEPVALDEALVFDHVIKPIFDQKCISCHNPEKLKGQLIMTDSKWLLKGGKSGKLFVPGKPEISLLLQRIHLPLEEKKHMPPSGKVQLTPEEITLLALWVKNNADFKKKVIELPADDSLRVLASARFQPAEAGQEQFSFAAADEETINKLNNDYRTIAPLAKESPALAVNLYNKSTYSPDRLQELSELKKQIVYLNLTKLPVKDGDLKSISQFENLEKLDLNFTDITGEGLKDLASLTHLRTLTLSGTKVNYETLQKTLPDLKSLKTVSVWNTALSASDIEKLQKAHRNIRFIAGFRDDGAAPITLNPPQVKNSSTIFGQSLVLQLKHPIKGVQIRYTTDGTEPDSVRSPVFREGTVLKETTSLKAKAFKEGWYGSATASFDFYKSTYKPDSVTILLPLNRVHQAEGPQTFFNAKLGTFNANSPAWANNWAGVRKNDLAFLSEFKKPVTVSSVSLRIMIEPETGIFPPAKVEIWGGSNPDQLTLLGTVEPPLPIQKSAPVLKTVDCRFKPQTVSYLKVVAKPVEKLPEWHPGKGKQALLLVDEAFIN